MHTQLLDYTMQYTSARHNVLAESENMNMMWELMMCTFLFDPACYGVPQLPQPPPPSSAFPLSICELFECATDNHKTNRNNNIEQPTSNSTRINFSSDHWPIADTHTMEMAMAVMVAIVAIVCRLVNRKHNIYLDVERQFWRPLTWPFFVVVVQMDTTIMIFFCINLKTQLGTGF